MRQSKGCNTLSRSQVLPSTHQADTDSDWAFSQANAEKRAADEEADRSVSQANRLAWTVEEARAKLGLGRTLMYELIASGKIGSVKAGGRRLISQQHLERFLAGD